MNKNFKRPFLILSCSILLSCNLSESLQKHNKAVAFLDEVNRLDETIIPSSVKFSDYLQTVGPIAKNDKNYQLDQNKIDSLKNYYETFMYSIDEATIKLAELKEFDTAFSIIKLTINYLKIIKNSYVSCIPTYLLVYKIGMTSASDSLKKIIDTGPEILNNGQLLAAKERQVKEQQLKQFMDKYKILNSN